MTPSPGLAALSRANQGEIGTNSTALVGYAVGGSLYDFVSEYWPYERKGKVWVAAFTVFSMIAAFGMLVISFRTL